MRLLPLFSLLMLNFDCNYTVDSEMDSEALAPICATVLILLIARISRRRRNIYRRNKQIWMRPSLRRRFLPGHDIQSRLDAYKEDDITPFFVRYIEYGSY